jgi:hypothetical protein
MYGVVPTPLEIPTEHRQVSKPPKSKQPFLISQIAGVYFFFSGAYLLIALALWGNPQSGLTTFLLAHKPLVYRLLPFLLIVNPDQVEGPKTAFIQGLPLAFLLMGLVSGFVAWKLWNLDQLWFFLLRYVLMFISGFAVLGMMGQTLRAGHTSVALQSPPMLVGFMLVQLPSFIYFFWNLWLFCYLVFDPKVNEACRTPGF